VKCRTVGRDYRCGGQNPPSRLTPLFFSSFSPPRAPRSACWGLAAQITRGVSLSSDEPNTAVIPIVVWRGVGPCNHHGFVNHFSLREISCDNPCHTLSKRELRDNSHTTLTAVNDDISNRRVVVMTPTGLSRLF